MRYTEKTHLIDSDYQSGDAVHSDLLIRITSSRFSYAIVDQTKDQIKVLFEASFVGGAENLDLVFLNNYLPQQEFKQVKVALETPAFTFIPAEMYSENHLDQYARFLQASASDLNVSAIQNLQLKNISTFNDQTIALLNHRFPAYKLYNLANPLIEASIKSCEGKGTSLILNFNTNTFEALVLRESKLSFYNAFHCRSIDDFNYFLLQILKELEIEQEDLNLLIAGQISHQDEKYKRIARYFTDLKFADSFIIPASDLFKSVPSHHFFSLTGLNLCE